jgi:hypothetical protein
MFYSYIGRKRKKIFHIGFHQINAPSSYAISQLFSTAKERHGLCKSYFLKKEEKKELKKMDKCPND